MNLRSLFCMIYGMSSIMMQATGGDFFAPQDNDFQEKRKTNDFNQNFCGNSGVINDNNPFGSAYVESITILIQQTAANGAPLNPKTTLATLLNKQRESKTSL